MKQADVLAIVAHISNRQTTLRGSQVFRFANVARTRSSRDVDSYRPSHYPDDPPAGDSDDGAQAQPRPKKTRKSRATKAATRAAKHAAAEQQSMQGRMDFRVPAQTPDPAASNTIIEPATATWAIAPQNEAADACETGHDTPAAVELGARLLTPAPTPGVNYGGIPTFGPNDAIQHPFPKPLPEGVNAMFGRYRYENTATDNAMLYPAGIPTEELGVIDPALLAVAHNAVQLPTPRASVTPNLSPFKLRSDTSSIAALSPLNVAADNAHPVGATAEPDKGEQSELREGTAAEAIPTAEGRKPSTKPPKPRPKGKAAVVLGRQKDVPPGTPAGRKSADALAVAEASKLGLPATRARTRKSHT